MIDACSEVLDFHYITTCVTTDLLSPLTPSTFSMRRSAHLSAATPAVRAYSLDSTSSTVATLPRTTSRSSRTRSRCDDADRHGGTCRSRCTVSRRCGMIRRLPQSSAETRSICTVAAITRSKTRHRIRDCFARCRLPRQDARRREGIAFKRSSGQKDTLSAGWQKHPIQQRSARSAMPCERWTGIGSFVKSS